MAKFIQICASEDDLFALDQEGDVHQYNFNTKTWLKLVRRPSADDQLASDGEGPEGASGSRARVRTGDLEWMTAAERRRV